MSRTSALTTFKLIGSPTNPTWPYCRPWAAWGAVLSLLGVIPVGRGGGVGDGDGLCPVAADDVVATLVIRRAFEPPAMMKLFNNSPAIHAGAHVLTAVSFRGVLGIIPSSGIR